MKMEIMPDPTNRIVLTKEMRKAAGFRPGEPLEISATLGAILITPKPVQGRVVTKAKRKVIEGPVANIDLAEAVRTVRTCLR